MAVQHNRKLKLKKSPSCILFLITSTLMGCSKAANKLGMYEDSLHVGTIFKNIVSAKEKKEDVWGNFNNYIDDISKRIQAIDVHIDEFTEKNCYRELHALRDLVEDQPYLKEFMLEIADNLKKHICLASQITTIQDVYYIHNELRKVYSAVYASNPSVGAPPCMDAMKFESGFEPLSKQMNVQFVNSFASTESFIKELTTLHKDEDKNKADFNSKLIALLRNKPGSANLIALLKDTAERNDLIKVKVTYRQCLKLLDSVRVQIKKHRAFREFKFQHDESIIAAAKAVLIAEDFLQKKIKTVCEGLIKTIRDIRDLKSQNPVLQELYDRKGCYLHPLKDFWENTMMNSGNKLIEQYGFLFYVVSHVHVLWKDLNRHFDQALQGRENAAEKEGPSPSIRHVVKQEVLDQQELMGMQTVEEAVGVSIERSEEDNRARRCSASSTWVGELMGGEELVSPPLPACNTPNTSTFDRGYEDEPDTCDYGAAGGYSYNPAQQAPTTPKKVKQSSVKRSQSPRGGGRGRGRGRGGQ